MKFGLLSQWFDPEPGGGAVSGVLASGLADRGHDVRILTGFPNYPGGQLYPGYRQRWRHIENPRASLEVRRSPLFTSHDGNPVTRALNYMSFAATSSMLAPQYLADCQALWVYNRPPPSGRSLGVWPGDRTCRSSCT